MNDTNSINFFGGIMNSNSKRLTAVIGLFVASILTTVMAFSSSASAATVTMFIVKPEDVRPISELSTGPSGWYKQTVGTASVALNAHQAGDLSGSAEFTVGTANSSAELALYKHFFASNRLADLETLNYSTWQQADGTKAVSLQIGVDLNISDGDVSPQGRLVFDPKLNLDNNFQPLTDGTWQSWATNTPDSRWSFTWSSSLDATRGANPCPASSPCTYADILSQYPGIGFNSGESKPLALTTGSGWSSFKGYADVPAVGTAFKQDLWNFEPSDTPEPVYPTTKDQCKNDGWASYLTLFTNQGQCVSYIVSSH